MTPEDAFNEKFRICNFYFKKAKEHSVKFCRHHLNRLEKQIDAKVSLEPGFGPMFKYIYTSYIFINKEKNELEIRNVMEEILFQENPLLTFIKKDMEYNNLYHCPLIFNTDEENKNEI